MIIKQSLMLGILLYCCYKAHPYRYDSDYLIPLYFLWFVTAGSTLNWLRVLCTNIPNIIKQLWVKKAKGNKGRARLASKKEIRGAHSNSKHAYIIGLQATKLIKFTIESCGMVLSPAGGGKTRDFVIPNLLCNPTNMIVADLKGTLAVITASARQKKLGHKVYCLNPSGRFAERLPPAARYNPLQVIINDWLNSERHRYLLDDIRKISLQLLPEPSQMGDNTFWRNGSRKLINFAILYLVTQFNSVTLAQVLDFLSEMDEIETTIYIAKNSEILNGDLARLASDLEGKLSGGKREQMESFREGALQVLEPFSSSGALAESTSTSDFIFSDLRRDKATVYIICDPTQAEVYESWIGLIMTSAISELIREEQGHNVGLMLDEITNFKVANLPKLMTSLREFKVHMWLIIQELEQFSEVYGRAAKDTLMSQTEEKIFHGSASQSTRELISKMVGDESYRETNYNVGRSLQDPVQRSVSEQARRIIFPDEVGVMSDIIVMKRGLLAFILERVGYHQIHPLRKWAKPNPYHGNKPYRGKVKVRL